MLDRESQTQAHLIRILITFPFVWDVTLAFRLVEFLVWVGGAHLPGRIVSREWLAQFNLLSNEDERWPADFSSLVWDCPIPMPGAK